MLPSEHPLPEQVFLQVMGGPCARRHDQALEPQARADDARFQVAPAARVHRVVRHALARAPRPQDGGADGQQAQDAAQPAGALPLCAKAMWCCTQSRQLFKGRALKGRRLAGSAAQGHGCVADVVCLCSSQGSAYALVRCTCNCIVWYCG